MTSSSGTTTTTTVTEHRSRITFTGHKDGVTTLALYSVPVSRATLFDAVLSDDSESVRDYERLYSGSYDSTIREWDVESQNCTHVFYGHEHTVWCLALSGDRPPVEPGSSAVPAVEGDPSTPGTTTKPSSSSSSSSEGGSSSGSSGGGGGTGGTGTLASSSSTSSILGSSAAHASASTTTAILTNSGNGGIAPEPEAVLNLFSCSRDHCIRGWDLNTRQCTTGAQVSSMSLRWVSVVGSKVYIASDDCTIKEYDILGNFKGKVYYGHTAGVTCVKLCQGYLYSASADYTVKQWSAERVSCVMTFRGHVGTVNALDIDARRQGYLYSGSHDFTVRQWHVDTGACTHVYAAHTFLVFSVVVEYSVFSYHQGDRGDHHHHHRDHHPQTTSATSSASTTTTTTTTTTATTSPSASSSDALGMQYRMWSASADTTIKEWDTLSNVLLRSFVGHEGYVWCMVLSPPPPTYDELRAGSLALQHQQQATAAALSRSSSLGPRRASRKSIIATVTTTTTTTATATATTSTSTSSSTSTSTTTTTTTTTITTTINSPSASTTKALTNATTMANLAVEFFRKQKRRLFSASNDGTIRMWDV